MTTWEVRGTLRMVWMDSKRLLTLHCPWMGRQWVGMGAMGVHGACCL